MTGFILNKENSQQTLIIIAGEVSGDIHGARLVAALKTQQPGLNIEGIGGDLMINEGLNAHYHIRQMAFMGLGEVLKHLPFIRKVFNDIIQLVANKKPAAVVLIDYPGFNLRLARRVKKMGVPIIYYISPQLWAWGKHRIHKIRKYIDKMLVIFPFEKEFYREHDIEAEYVGHPLADSHYRHISPKKTDGEKNVLGLLPGSRRQELEKLFPDMIETAQRLKEADKIDRALILKVNTIPIEEYKKYIGDRSYLQIYESSVSNFYNQLDAAIVSSGTATLETAYFRVPMVIVYRVNSLTWHLGKRLVKLDMVGLVNIVAGEKIAVEMLQNDFQPKKAEDEIAHLLDPETNHEVRQKMTIIKEQLGEPGASERAARIIVSIASRSGATTQRKK